MTPSTPLSSIGPVFDKRNRTARRWPRTVLIGAMAASLVFAAACGGSSKPAPAGTASAPVEDTPGTSATASPTATASPARATTPDTAAALRRRGQFEAAAIQYAAQAASAETPRLRVAALVLAAAAHYEAGDPEDAIARLRTAVSVETGGALESTRALYLLALRLNEAGRPREAIDSATPGQVASASGPLALYFLAERADAYIALGAEPGSADQWGALLKQPTLSPDLAERGNRAIAASRAALGDHASQAIFLERALAISGDAATRFSLAEALLNAGDRPAAIREFGAIITTTPGSRFAHLAVIALRDLGEAVDAGAEGLVYYRRSLYADAIRVLRPFSEALAAEPGEAWAFATYYLAASYDDSGLVGEAIPVYDSVAALTPGSPYAHRALYWAARASEREGDATATSARYGVLAIGTAGEFSDEASFRAGYVLYAAAEPTAALAAWKAAGAEGPRVDFWRARALAGLGNVVEARQLYEITARTDRFGFYGIEAARELAGGEMAAPTYARRALGREVDWTALAAWAGAAAETIDTSVAEEFAAAGLTDPARVALYQLCSAGASIERTLGCLRAATGLGLTDVALRFAVRLRIAKGVTWADAPRSLLRLAYPVDFPELVDEEAKTADLDPLFLAALVRQESAWDASAVSPADAYGLTQVIEPTGKALAEALGVSPFTVRDLLRPEISLRFGARYIADQLLRFGRVDAALAAYNAGPGRAERWLGIAGASGTPEFVAAIDIEETSGYVAAILEHYMHYLMAYAEVR